MGMDALNNAAFQQSKQVSSEPKQVAESQVAVQMAQPSKAKDILLRGQAAQPSADEIKTAISSANKRAHFGHTSAEFSYHESTKRISVKIIDEDTNEVIREIPPEETLEMISKMWELAGLMVDEKR